jgi:hypothetical protein
MAQATLTACGVWVRAEEHDSPSPLSERRSDDLVPFTAHTFAQGQGPADHLPSSPLSSRGVAVTSL